MLNIGKPDAIQTIFGGLDLVFSFVESCQTNQKMCRNLTGGFIDTGKPIKLPTPLRKSSNSSLVTISSPIKTTYSPDASESAFRGCRKVTFRNHQLQPILKNEQNLNPFGLDTDESFNNAEVAPTTPAKPSGKYEP